MERRIIWRGLTVKDYIHPEEEAARASLVQNNAFQKAISMASDISLKLHKTVIEGTYIRLTPQTAPRLFDILADACRILNYPKIPEIYTCHMLSQSVTPCSSEDDYLVIADYVLDTFDDGMLYYAFGNAISMIMAGHVKITTAAAYLPSNLLLTIPQIPFKRYLHLADATSDRGGLLACQSLAAAARCHFLELGLPPARTRQMFPTDLEAEDYIERYLRDTERKNSQNSKLIDAAGWWVTATYVEAPANWMLQELYSWYLGGYQDLVRKYQKA